MNMRSRLETGAGGYLQDVKLPSVLLPTIRRRTVNPRCAKSVPRRAEAVEMVKKHCDRATH